MLKSDRVRISVSDKQSWPDFEQTGASNAVLAVDAIKLHHVGFLPEDKSYAKLQCVSRQSNAPEDFDSLAREAGDHLSVGGGFAVSVATTLLTATLSAPASAVVSTAIALADPVSLLVNGQTLWGALGELRDADKQLDRIAFHNATVFGGRWERAPKRGWNPLSAGDRRWYNGGDPGPCELLSRWERYLPAGA